MMKKKKRWLSLCMAAVMCITLLGGCSSAKKPEGESQNGSTAPSGQTGGNQDGKDQDGNSAPMGRYVEEEIAFPLEEGETVFDMAQAADGTLYAYIGTKDSKEQLSSLNRYCYEGGGWSKDTPEWLIAAVSEHAMNISNVMIGVDGSEYVIYTEPEVYRFHVLRSMDGKTYEEVLTDLLCSKVEGYDFHPSMEALVGLDEGKMLVLGYWVQSGVYNKDSKLEYQVQAGSSNTDRRFDYGASKNEFVIRGERVWERHDMVSGETKEEIPAMDNAAQQQLQMAADGSLFACDSAGIHHIANGGTIWETVVDGSLNSLGMPSLYVSRFFVGQNDDFYVVMSPNGGEKMLLHFTYDPDMVSVPTNSLSIYGIKDSATLQQAAALFQKRHPDIRVTVNSANLEFGDIVDDDVIRALNTELLSGKGSDVLLLDGLPVRSYIEKGVLADLSDVIAPYEQAGTILPAVLDNSKTDGKIYGIPARIEMPVVVGTDEALAALESMETLQAYHTSGGKNIFRKMVYESLLRICTQMYYDEIFAEDGTLRPDALKTLLETVKAAGESCGAQTLFETPQDGQPADYFNRVLDRGFDFVDLYGYIGGSRALGSVSVTSSTGIMMANAATERMETNLHNLRNIYLPLHTIGINAASPNMDLAKEFVSLVFSLEVQQEDFYDGMPVNTEAIDVWAAKEVDLSIGTSMTDENGVMIEISAEWPGQERAAEILSMAKNCTLAVDVDEVLMKMIVEGSNGYFSGENTLEEAVSAIENKTGLYFAE